MRSTRIIAAVVALALLALAPWTAGAADAAPSHRQAKPKHDVFATAKELGNTNKFVTFGHVSTFKGRSIAIQRKDCPTCKWKGYKKTKTSAKDGHFRTRITPGKKVPSRVCYRVNVPSTQNYRRTKVFVGCIKTERV
jgi:hypothetical protein